MLSCPRITFLDTQLRTVHEPYLLTSYILDLGRINIFAYRREALWAENVELQNMVRFSKRSTCLKSPLSSSQERCYMETLLFLTCHSVMW